MISQLSENKFEELFKVYFTPLTHYAMKYLKDFDTSREIVHNVFLNLWDKRDEVDFQKSVKSYLYTSTYNRCLNYIRDHKKFNRDELSIEMLEQNTEAQYHDKLAEKELQHKIDEAINILPDKCKEIFKLNRFQALKYSEIAAKLNISIKTVEAQMSKALKLLRAELAEYLTFLLLVTEIIKIG
ncbi:MAG: RNA polymerase sigma-70 factor [Bacteroidetes bacterium]|jgi:RNA polymerase sigma-70 factor (ECF subfamily)|nr:RNA polymerase sigma-70 factor [Bacteroidota bacterium]